VPTRAIFVTGRFGNAFFSRNAETDAAIGSAENVSAWRQNFGCGARGCRVKSFSVWVFLLEQLG